MSIKIDVFGLGELDIENGEIIDVSTVGTIRKYGDDPMLHVKVVQRPYYREQTYVSYVYKPMYFTVNEGIISSIFSFNRQVAAFKLRGRL